VPFVSVYLKAALLPADLEHTDFHETLRLAVSTALDCPADEAGSVPVSEVDVHYVERSEDDKPDWDIVVVVDARKTPTRMAEQESRSARLKRVLEPSIPHSLSFCVCVNLNDTVWQTGTGRGRP